MADRYFVESPIAGGRATLIGAEAHHLAHVMRAKPGDEVVLFDGSGWEFSARVERVGRSDVELSVVERRHVDRERDVEVTLGVALPKGDRQRWLVEKAVEVGVARLVPLATARGVTEPGQQAVARLRRAVIEASKQCGRNRLMTIADPQPLSGYLAGATDAPRWLAHPGGTDVKTALAEQSAAARQPSEIRLAIGPEGGFTDDEVESARQCGWLVVDLGPATLRVETAAVVIAALVSCQSQ